jgi:hypothetical protein
MFDVKIMYMPNEKDDKNLVDESEYQKRRSQEIKVTVSFVWAVCCDYTQTALSSSRSLYLAAPREFHRVRLCSNDNSS